MLATKEDIEKYLINYCFEKKLLTIDITLNCNIKCRHCKFIHDSNQKVITEEIIKLAIDSIDDTWLVSIFGGECMLYPNLVEYAGNYCKQKGFKWGIFTNGFWADDKKTCQFIEQLNPDILVISVDKYHQEFIPYKKIQKIIKYFRKHKTINLLGSTIETAEAEKKNMKKFNRLKLNYIYSAFTPENTNDANIKWLYGPVLFGCSTKGFRVLPNGDITCNCAKIDLCKFGNVKEKSIKDLLQRYFKDQIGPLMFLAPGNEMITPEVLCEENEYLDDYWNTKNIHIKIFDKQGKHLDIHEFINTEKDIVFYLEEGIKQRDGRPINVCDTK